MPEDTIPRPIRYKFLSVAQEVCDLAKVDYWEQTEVLSSLREQMEISYRAYDQASRFEDDPETKALEDFGSPKDVARVHRNGIKGLWYRLLFNQRYAVHRLIGPVVFCLWHFFFNTTGGMGITFIGVDRLRLHIPIFGWDYYIGVIIITLTLLPRLVPKNIPLFRRVAEAIALSVAVWFFFGKLATEWGGSMVDWRRTWDIYDDVPRWKNVMVGMFELSGFTMEAVAFFFVLAMSAAEILEIPACHQAVIEAKRKGNLANAGEWALWLDNSFKFLTGQKRGLVWKIVRS